MSYYELNGKGGDAMVKSPKGRRLALDGRPGGGELVNSTIALKVKSISVKKKG